MPAFHACDTEASRRRDAEARCAVADTSYLPLHFRIRNMPVSDGARRAHMRVYSPSDSMLYDTVAALPCEREDGDSFCSATLRAPGNYPVSGRVEVVVSGKKFIIDSIRLSPRPAGGGIGHLVFPDCEIAGARVNGRRVEMGRAGQTYLVLDVGMERENP